MADQVQRSLVLAPLMTVTWQANQLPVGMTLFRDYSTALSWRLILHLSFSFCSSFLKDRDTAFYVADFRSISHIIFLLIISVPAKKVNNCIPLSITMGLFLQIGENGSSLMFLLVLELHVAFPALLYKQIPEVLAFVSRIWCQIHQFSMSLRRQCWYLTDIYCLMSLILKTTSSSVDFTHQYGISGDLGIC